MILVLAAVVVGGVVALVLAAAGARRRRPSREGSFAPAGVLVAVGVGGIVVLLLGAAFVMVGVGGPGDHEPPPGTTAAPTSTPAPPDHSDRPATSLPGARIEPAPPLAVVAVNAADPNRFAPYDVVDALPPDAVVRVRAAGFSSFEAGTAQQCVSEVGRLPGCTPPFPVQFAENGRAEFQYLLGDSFAPGSCRSGAPTCTLRILGATSGREGSIQTVFGDEVVVGRVTVASGSGIVDRQQLTVSVDGFPAGEHLLATVCAPPGRYDARRCAGAETASRFRVEPDGSGRTELVVATGEIGADRVACGPRRACGVTVASDAGFSASPTVPIAFSLGPGAGYHPGRLAAGLAVAALLVMTAMVLIRRTDWRTLTEAATPAVDSADLQTELSLDDLFGSDEELDARDPVGL